MKTKYALKNIILIVKKTMDSKFPSKKLAEWAFEGWNLYDEKLRSEKKETTENELCREILYDLSVDYDLLEGSTRNKKIETEAVKPGEVGFSKKYLRGVLDAITDFKTGKKYKLPILRTK